MNIRQTETPSIDARSTPKPIDAAREHIHDQQHPVATQENRFAAEQVDTPEAILRVRDECQPGGTIGAGVAGPIVLREHAANDILVDRDAEDMRDLLGDAHAAETRIAPLHLDDGCDEFRGRTFGTGLCGDADEEEKSRRYLRSTRAWWNLNSVAGLMSAPSFAIRRGLTNSVVRPSTTRSSGVEIRGSSRFLYGRKDG
ncbi:MAG: hypothetical protein MZW92_60830 [Comamonadaceae bacterium]|nr:hypothetical protein [Comamonadaceae bacterium]